MNSKNPEGKSPLHQSAFGGWLEVVRALVESGAELDAADSGGITALSYACTSHSSVVEYLVERGAEVSRINSDGTETPLCLACMLANRNSVEALLRGCADPNQEIHSRYVKGYPLNLAAELGSSNIVAMLIEYRANVDALTGNGESPLILASGNMIDEVQFRKTRREISGGYVDQGIPVNKERYSISSEIGHNKKCVDLLLAAGANANLVTTDTKQCALHFAVCAMDNSIVEALIASGADLDIMNENGFSPIMGAAELGSAPIVRSLLKSGADPTLRNNGGQTAMDIATDHGHRGVRSLLRRA